MVPSKNGRCFLAETASAPDRLFFFRLVQGPLLGAPTEASAGTYTLNGLLCTIPHAPTSILVGVWNLVVPAHGPVSSLRAGPFGLGSGGRAVRADLSGRSVIWLHSSMRLTKYYLVGVPCVCVPVI